ncbi:unnamed protein product [Gadus morhua 'NCC']
MVTTLDDYRASVFDCCPRSLYLDGYDPRTTRPRTRGRRTTAWGRGPTGSYWTNRVGRSSLLVPHGSYWTNRVGWVLLGPTGPDRVGLVLLGSYWTRPVGRVYWSYYQTALGAGPLGPTDQTAWGRGSYWVLLDQTVGRGLLGFLLGSYWSSDQLRGAGSYWGPTGPDRGPVLLVLLDQTAAAAAGVPAGRREEGPEDEGEDDDDDDDDDE